MQIDKKNKILISPLDWGLGHASRIIPIINILQKKQNEIIIAANGNTKNFLQTYFPDLKFIDIPDYKITYSQKKIILKLILQIPKIIITIHREHKALKKIIKIEKINYVISDNRYGLWNKKIKSIFITHQINIKLPKSLKIFEKLLYKINKKLIEQFDYCLIPDEPNSAFTGELTNKHVLPDNARFIGLLSRFLDTKNTQPTKNKKYDIFVILSGAEPQKTEFLNLIINKFINTDFKVLIISGTINKKQRKINNISIMHHLNDTEFVNAVKNTPYIISRAGYTTIMDLTVLQKSAILIPTPGQTEQEYLAQNNTDFNFITQKDFINLKIKELSYIKINRYKNNLLEKVFSDILSCL